MTIFGSQLPRGLGKFVDSAEQIEVVVDMHTRILVEVNWQSDHEAPVLIIIHGLGGDARRSYVLGTADKAWRSGFTVVRMNMRNSGGTEAWTPTLYHAGLTDDLEATVNWLSRVAPGVPLVYCGYSLGGSVTLNALAKWGKRLPEGSAGTVVVSVPMDLHAADVELGRAGINRLYVKYFLRRFQNIWGAKHAVYPDLYPRNGLKEVSTIRDFDEKWTGPNFGYSGADEYYSAAQMVGKLQDVHLRGLVVHAEDDPFVPLTQQAHAALAEHSNLRLLLSEMGGHVGFLGRSPNAEPSGWRDFDRWWAENRVVHAATQFLRMGE
ncbi:MAG: alpha/beta fold hydrolase [Planctomycetes bacterium]|nr:alpha/beta fold hydrolase [Planctomycetota bacterium]